MSFGGRGGVTVAGKETESFIIADLISDLVVSIVVSVSMIWVDGIAFDSLLMGVPFLGGVGSPFLGGVNFNDALKLRGDALLSGDNGRPGGRGEGITSFDDNVLLNDGIISVVSGTDKEDIRDRGGDTLFGNDSL